MAHIDSVRNKYLEFLVGKNDDYNIGSGGGERYIAAYVNLPALSVSTDAGVQSLAANKAVLKLDPTWFGAASNGHISNTKEFEFAKATTQWGAISGFVLFRAANTTTWGDIGKVANVLQILTLMENITISTDDILVVPKGSFTLTMT